MTIISNTGEEMKAGVMCFLSHNGLIDGPIQQICGRYPCLRVFDCRDGFTQQPAPIFAARCGQIMFCKNCSILMCALGNTLDLAATTEIFMRIIVPTRAAWVKEEQVQSFYDFGSQPYRCDDKYGSRKTSVILSQGPPE